MTMNYSFNVSKQLCFCKASTSFWRPYLHGMKARSEVIEEARSNINRHPLACAEKLHHFIPALVKPSAILVYDLGVDA